MTEEDMEKRNIPEKDRKTITKVGYINKLNISRMPYLGPELSEPDVPPLHQALARLEESLWKPSEPEVSPEPDAGVCPDIFYKEPSSQ